MKRKRVYRRMRINFKFVLLILMIFGISLGYAILNTNINVTGKVHLIAGNYIVNLELLNTKTSNNITFYKTTFGGEKELEIMMEPGYFLYRADCTNGYTVDGVVTGLDSYSKSQTVLIRNNLSSAGSLCSFFAKMVEAQEVAYTNDEHVDIEDVKAALDYLYLALGYEDLPPKTIEALVVAYTHEDHPEFKTVKDALDYIYNKTVK